MKIAFIHFVHVLNDSQAEHMHMQFLLWPEVVQCGFTKCTKPYVGRCESVCACACVHVCLKTTQICSTQEMRLAEAAYIAGTYCMSCILHAGPSLLYTLTPQCHAFYCIIVLSFVNAGYTVPAIDCLHGNILLCCCTQLGGSVYIALSLIRITGICLHVPQGGFTCLHHRESLESVDIVTYLIHNGAPVDMPSNVCT